MRLTGSWWLLLLITSLGTGCLGGPSARPAALDLSSVITHHKPPGPLPFLYFATLRNGNLERLDGLTIGNGQVFPVVEVDTTDLQTGELAPLGVDPAGFLVVAGIQGKPRGTIQTVDLKTGRTRKAIGESIAEEPWTIRFFAPPATFIADRATGKDTWEAVARFHKDGDIHTPLTEGQYPTKYFGAGPDGQVLYAHTAEDGASVLWALWQDKARVEKLALFAEELIDVLWIENRATLSGLALTAGRGETGTLNLWTWTTGETPRLVREFPSRGTLGLTPDGWPINLKRDRCVIAIPSRTGDESEAGIYLYDAGSLVLTHSGHAELAWLVEPGHLFWLDQGTVHYRVLEAAEESAIELHKFPAQRSFAIYPGAGAIPPRM